jgi:hypothetical protein
VNLDVGDSITTSSGSRGGVDKANHRPVFAFIVNLAARAFTNVRLGEFAVPKAVGGESLISI